LPELVTRRFLTFEIIIQSGVLPHHLEEFLHSGRQFPCKMCYALADCQSFNCCCYYGSLWHIQHLGLQLDESLKVLEHQFVVLLVAIQKIPRGFCAQLVPLEGCQKLYVYLLPGID